MWRLWSCFCNLWRLFQMCIGGSFTSSKITKWVAEFFWHFMQGYGEPISQPLGTIKVKIGKIGMSRARYIYTAIYCIFIVNFLPCWSPKSLLMKYFRVGLLMGYSVNLTQGKLEFLHYGIWSPRTSQYVNLAPILQSIVHRCGASGSMRACHAAGPGSIPGRERFPGWGFFGVFPHL